MYSPFEHMSGFNERKFDLQAAQLPEVDEEKQMQLDLESLVHEAPQIVATFLAQEGVQEYILLEVAKTKKSVYGSLEIEGKKYFVKVAAAHQISQELRGYRMANVFRHERVRGHHFTDAVGLYIQDYCNEVDEGNLLMTALNRAMLTGEPTEHEILAKTNRIFHDVALVFNNTIIETDSLDGKNDAFFYNRLKPGGRIESYYQQNTQVLTDTETTIGVRDIFENRYAVNGRLSELNIDQQVKNAQTVLEPSQSRILVLSQGDPTESNLSLSGKFFDFEVAGFNALAQELAIFFCHTYVSGHYITPKYSGLTSEQDKAFASKFQDQVAAEYEFNDRGQLQIYLSYPLPTLKSKLIEEYNNIVVKTAEKKLTPKQNKMLLKQFKSAVLLRLIGVRNIVKFEKKDFVLYLGLIAHFSQATEHDSVSTFVQDMFITLPYEQPK